MRIDKIKLAGLAAALAGSVSANPAEATDRTISTTTTTPVTTAQPEPPGNVTPGNITIQSGGGVVRVNANQTAVTINSNNNVTNAGEISSADADNSTGVLLTGGFSGNLTSSGIIRLDETYALTDSDSDGNLDGAWAQGTNRHGVLLNSGPSFTGDITISGNTTIEGNNSSGITLEALLVGDLNHTGVLSVTGDNSYAVAITGGPAAGVNGDVRIAGSVTVRGANSGGLLVDAPITGALNVNGAWTVTGFHSTTTGSSTTGLDADDLLISAPAIAIHQSVLGGVTIQGLGLEDDLDDDFDGLDDTGADTDDDATAAITSYGSGEALLIEADGVNNVVIGPTSTTGYGVHVRGALTGFGVYNGVQATAVRIAGNGASTVMIADGVVIDSTVRSTSFDANSYGVVIGAGASISEILARREITSTVSSDLDRTAYGLTLNAGANVPTLSNSGLLVAQVFGETGDAVAVRDQSNTLASITNSGSIIARAIATDTDPADDVPPPTPTGDLIAIDLSASTIDVTISQIADVPFPDDDTVDSDVNFRPDVKIEGDILFGTGNDDLNLLSGDIIGDVSFGAGTDSFVIDNGGVFAGRISDSDGQLSINVIDGVLTHAGGTTNLTSATFGADGALAITISDIVGQSTLIQASGVVTFANGATVTPIVPIGLPNSGSHTFLTAAGGLVGEEFVVGAVTGSNVPYLYSLSVNTVSGDPNSLEASYIMRTPTQLGLTANQTQAFNPLIEALRLDDDAAAAFASLTTQGDFLDAYGDLMPSFASAATELAATAIQQSQSAASNRLATTRLHGLDEVSAWAQEIGYGLERTPPTVNGQAYDGQGFGIALGIDGPLANGALFGLSASFLASEAQEAGRPEGEISTWLAQGNAYLGAAMGPVDLDFVVGGGFGKMRSRRFIEIGDAFSAQTEAEWWAFEGHGAARASVPLALTDWLVVTPQAALTYVALNEQAYEESGGGVAFDIEGDSVTSQRLWADAGIELSARWRFGANGFISPRIYGGYRANAIDDAAERTFRFIAAGSDFTLTDEALGDGGPLVGIGLDATNGFSTISLSYEGEFGDQIDRHSLNAAVRFRF